jgi:hypothetical protein
MGEAGLELPADPKVVGFFEFVPLIFPALPLALLNADFFLEVG